MTVQIPRVGPRLAAAAGAFLVLVLVAGCSGGAESGTAPAPEESASPSPEPPALSEPIDLDYSGHVLTDDGRDRALLVDWSNGQLRAIDNQGTELWAERVQLDDEMMSAPVAYSSGDIVIIDDLSGELVARQWTDGAEAWRFAPAEAGAGCHEDWGFGPSTTATGTVLEEGDVILLEYFMAMKKDSCTTGADGDPLVIALDPATGEEAWPALTVGAGGLPFGGSTLSISPDRSYGLLPWADDGSSMLTRVDLATGEHTTLDLTELRTADDTGVEWFSVVPTGDPSTAVYVYGAQDPDDPYSGLVQRQAFLTVPEGLPMSDAGALTPLDPEEHAEAYAALDLEDTFDPVCTAQPVFTPTGEGACIMVQLFASTVAYWGSDLAAIAWQSEEQAPESVLEYATPESDIGGAQYAAVDGPEGPLLVVPTVDSSVAAFDAASGEVVWSSEAQGGSDPWGGQGYLPDLDLVPVVDDGELTFYDAATGEAHDSLDVADFASLSSTTRFLLVTEDRTSRLWTVTGG